MIVSEHGKALDTLYLPAPPSQEVVAADFNGDGLTDLVVVTPSGVYGYAQVGPCA